MQIKLRSKQEYDGLRNNGDMLIVFGVRNHEREPMPYVAY